MTEQEIEHVAKAIYLVRTAPRRFPRDWNELSLEARRSFEKDAIAAITALDALRGTAWMGLPSAAPEGPQIRRCPKYLRTGHEISTVRSKDAVRLGDEP